MVALSYGLIGALSANPPDISTTRVPSPERCGRFCAAALMVPPQVIPSEPDCGRHAATYRAAAAPMKERTSIPPIGTGTTMA